MAKRKRPGRLRQAINAAKNARRLQPARLRCDQLQGIRTQQVRAVLTFRDWLHNTVTGFDFGKTQ